MHLCRGGLGQSSSGPQFLSTPKLGKQFVQIVATILFAPHTNGRIGFFFARHTQRADAGPRRSRTGEADIPPAIRTAGMGSAHQPSEGGSETAGQRLHGQTARPQCPRWESGNPRYPPVSRTRWIRDRPNPENSAARGPERLPAPWRRGYVTRVSPAVGRHARPLPDAAPAPPAPARTNRRWPPSCAATSPPTWAVILYLWRGSTVETRYKYKITAGQAPSVTPVAFPASSCPAPTGGRSQGLGTNAPTAASGSRPASGCSRPGR